MPEGKNRALTVIHRSKQAFTCRVGVDPVGELTGPDKRS
jgi:hypothetical protein